VISGFNTVVLNGKKSDENEHSAYLYIYVLYTTDDCIHTTDHNTTTIDGALVTTDYSRTTTDDGIVTTDHVTITTDDNINRTEHSTTRDR
jgi:hypothetical protein